MAGVFFADMTKAHPIFKYHPRSIWNLQHRGQVPSPGHTRPLVVLHALLLGVAFVIVFPFGAIGFADSVEIGLHNSLGSSASRIRERP